jgi:hypothetical protein
VKTADATGTYIAPDGTFRETTQWGAPSGTHRTNVPSAAQQCLLLTSGRPFRAWIAIRASARRRCRRYAVAFLTQAEASTRFHCGTTTEQRCRR